MWGKIFLTSVQSAKLMMENLYLCTRFKLILFIDYLLQDWKIRKPPIRRKWAVRDRRGWEIFKTSNPILGHCTPCRRGIVSNIKIFQDKGLLDSGSRRQLHLSSLPFDLSQIMPWSHKFHITINKEHCMSEYSYSFICAHSEGFKQIAKFN